MTSSYTLGRGQTYTMSYQAHHNPTVGSYTYQLEGNGYTDFGYAIQRPGLNFSPQSISYMTPGPRPMNMGESLNNAQTYQNIHGQNVMNTSVQYVSTPPQQHAVGTGRAHQRRGSYQLHNIRNGGYGSPINHHSPSSPSYSSLSGTRMSHTSTMYQGQRPNQYPYIPNTSTNNNNNIINNNIISSSLNSVQNNINMSPSTLGDPESLQSQSSQPYTHTPQKYNMDRRQNWASNPFFVNNLNNSNVNSNGNNSNSNVINHGNNTSNGASSFAIRQQNTNKHIAEISRPTSTNNNLTKRNERNNAVINRYTEKTTSIDEGSLVGSYNSDGLEESGKDTNVADWDPFFFDTEWDERSVSASGRNSYEREK